MSNAVKDLTKGSPTKLILGFMLPMLLGIIFQQFYNMVDTIVVGQFLGINSLAGVGLTGSLNFLVLGFCIGTCAGFAIPVAQKFGEKDFDGLRRYVGNTIWLGAAFAVIMTLVTCLLCGNMLELMNAPGDFNAPDSVIRQAYSYIFVIFLGLPVTFLYNILSGIIRSLGDSKSPVIFLVISSILNVGLDLLFIVVFGMGVAGAGWATVLAQLISGILCLIYMIKKFDILRLKKEDIRINGRAMARLCSMGLPMGLQYSITAIGSILMQTAVNGLGEVYIAAVTAGSKVSQFACCPFDAMGSTMATYSGQNIGAGEIARVEKGVRRCSVIGVVYAAVAMTVLMIFGGNIAMIFVNSSEPAVLEQVRGLAGEFLFYNGMFYIPLAFVNIIRFSIQGLGNSRLALFAGVFEMVARGGAALALVPVFGFIAVCLASPAAWIMADMFLLPAFFYTIKMLKRRHIPHPPRLKENKD